MLFESLPKNKLPRGRTVGVFIGVGFANKIISDTKGGGIKPIGLSACN